MVSRRKLRRTNTNHSTVYLPSHLRSRRLKRHAHLTALMPPSVKRSLVARSWSKWSPASRQSSLEARHKKFHPVQYKFFLIMQARPRSPSACLRSFQHVFIQTNTWAPQSMAWIATVQRSGVRQSTYSISSIIFFHTLI